MKEEKKGKKQYTPEEKADLLLEFVQINNRCPKKDEVWNGVKIGIFWDNIKQGLHKKLYETTLSKNHILKEDYDRVQLLKEEKKGKRIDSMI